MFETTFETTNRKLENFLYAHNIVPVGTTKTEDFLTSWTFEDTPELRKVIAEYAKIYGGEKHHAEFPNITPSPSSTSSKHLMTTSQYTASDSSESSKARLMSL